MKDWYKRIMLAEDDGGGGSAVDLLDEPKDAAAVPDEPVGSPAAPAFDPAALAGAFAQSLKDAGIGAPQPAVEKPLTPEEAKKLLNVWEPDDTFMAKFGNLETQKAALGEMRDAIVRQMDTIAQLRLAEQAKLYEDRLTPIQQYYVEQQAVAREGRFNKAYPDFAKPELKPLLTSVVQGLIAQKALDPKDEGKTFKTIGDAMLAVIKQANPDYKMSSGGPQGKRSGSALPATTSGAGGGGGSGKAANTSGKPLAIQLLS